jgi:hypothetical protein
MHQKQPASRTHAPDRRRLTVRPYTAADGIAEGEGRLFETDEEEVAGQSTASTESLRWASSCAVVISTASSALAA